MTVMDDTDQKIDRRRREKITIRHYEAPAGGWGSVKSLAKNITQERTPSSALLLTQHNKPEGYQCTSCAWAKPAKPHPFEFCENGAKATFWDNTPKRVGPEFFAQHTLAELENWNDHDLEEVGRLTHPMRWDRQSDTYRAVSWASAFEEIGRELKMLDPKSTVFYASGRASLETSYMYALFARLYGHNNLPDSSNMCHESTSVALPESIGAPVGTVLLEDFEETDCIFFFGQNVGSNSPRMLHELQDASKRGVPIVVFNPLRERGLESFTNPQAPLEMVTGSATRIASQYHQVQAGGDIAAMMGICKHLLALDDAAREAGTPRVLDVDFIAAHTHGFSDFEKAVRGYEWSDLERRSGLSRAALESAADIYAKAEKVIGIFGMGLTQQRAGVESVQMVANLLLLRGNIGKPGAGICPVRGHSNVQGQRTVGITEKPELVPSDKLRALYGFEPPQEKGLNTVEACEAMIRGEITAFIGLGGNFIRAVPDRFVTEPAWRKLHLSVQVATKLNRSHVVHGEIAYLLPTLVRPETDIQHTGPQAVSVEDSTTCIHGSLGFMRPASEHLLSEPAIVAAIAKATLPPNPKIDWDAWVGDYSLVRDAIEATYPEQFKDFNQRYFQSGGFARPIKARNREWATKNGKANFITPTGLNENSDESRARRDVVQLITLRSNDQFNTTIYGYDDRFRGIHGTRMVLLIHREDMERFRLKEGELVSVHTVSSDNLHREVKGLRVVPYNIPQGCVAGYYPELNPLIPLWHHADRSMVPAAKSIPVTITKLDDGQIAVLSDRSGTLGAENNIEDTGMEVAEDVARDLGGGAGLAGTMLSQRLKRKPVQSAVIALGLAAAAALFIRSRSRR